MARAELEAELLTPGQAARLLGRSKVRVLQLTAAGRLPCIRTPLGRLLPAGAVRDFIRDRDGEPSADIDASESAPLVDMPADPMRAPAVTADAPDPLQARVLEMIRQWQTDATQGGTQ